ncbi:sulfotransferase [Gloeocapsa sp. PCC 73106]|uniref:sulfotransferase n=1 Tax=Gloeocapsa sp. PCC 73106 TaxID=102232 RepID=UPI0002ABF2CA|nr:sulfotransferase [Gloeocapsa sp. PCC 73106]ELR97090.1 sulfotransferase family protein [Gloeocapsa sp. PCC 73106]
MLQIYLSIVSAAWKVYGLRWKFWSWLIVLPVYIIFTRVTLLLDNIFFPQYRQLQIKNPVFIIGNPRSGTTFLHLLLNKTGEFVSFKSWEIFFPALTARFLFKPLVNYLIKTKQTTILPEESGHPMGIDVIEHDEFLFFHKLNTQFVILLSPLAFDGKAHPELCFYDQQDESRRQSSVEFSRRCFQRQMYYLKKEQIIAHGHFSTYRIKSILEVFPDAKFIYILRSPYETIPSHLTLEYNTFKYQGRLNEVSPKQVQKYFELRYKYDLELYRYFYNIEHNQEIPQDKLLVITYEKMRTKLRETVAEVVEFTGIKLSDQLQQVVEEQASKQGSYKRKHEVMSLEEFNLTRDKITEDFSFLLKEYGYD